MKNLHALLPIGGHDFNATGAGVDWLAYLLTAANYKFFGYVSEPLEFFCAHPGSLTITKNGNTITKGYSLVRNWCVLG
jgi:hypothetical protein